jgi:DNA-directed RNA polymerase subunit N (RpoN/RPB10)
MLPLKCFNCGKIGHFENKFPYAKKLDSDEEEDPNKENKYQKGSKKYKRKVFKRNIYSREDIYSSEEDDEINSDSKKLLFMDT